MRRFTKDDHSLAGGLDQKPPEKPQVARLHSKRYKNFLVEHGRMIGERMTVLHFALVKMEPGRFLELLKRTFDCRTPPAVSYDSQVILGGYQELGVQDAFSVRWSEDLSDGMLGWIDRKVQELDRALS